MSRGEWLKTRQELERAKVALAEIEKVVERLATSRSTKISDLRKAQEKLARRMARVERLATIEINLRRLSGVREVERRRRPNHPGDRTRMKFGIKFDVSMTREISEPESFPQNLSEVKAMQRRVEADTRKAAARALNKTADKTATAAAREINDATKIPVREVRKRLIVRRASSSRLVAEIQALPYAPNLSKFRPTQNKAGVAASAWERRKTYKHAFIHPRTGRVVTRTTNKRTPLKGLRGPSVRSTFMQERVITKLDAVARQAWRTNMEHELARELRKSM